MRYSKFLRIAVSGLMAVSIFGATSLPALSAGRSIAVPPPAGMMLSKGAVRNGLTLNVANVVHPNLMRQLVAYRTDERVGTVVINTGQKFLYFVLPGGMALRYGIGVARQGFEWSGTHKISAKRKWPSWTPPAEMRQRRPDIPAFMEGGPKNPMGARGLYIGSTLYRIHGTTEPWSIGGNVSSGCIRLTNEDVIDLYARVKIGAKVVVL